MKTTYKHISFGKHIDGHWLCYNNRQKSTLGLVEWYKDWKQWVFCPSDDCVFSVSCMNDVIDFLGQLEAPCKPA